ncbi:rhodanese-like domain-containing protein [Oceanospirillum sediminis]|uniref:Rhodanese-like domain-containing protein n=1 Tax=Oceanospirillum sediminis TaxID=2760088 RepID=A0A839IU10_9GAMM|nr:rhodanese-like domain-containing protein [Oceanospirillum sediminis]MBB1488170.1 rhodanese-like domain-containing protein [Oceanospirillum sediminis]
MTIKITKGIYQLVEEANQVVEEISVEQAQALHGQDGIQFVDIRDVRELQRDGVIPGAYHCPRGMLEFWVDPESPYAKEIFQQELTFVLYCGGGLRSALAGRTIIDMGLTNVKHVHGGFAAWRKAGGQIEEYKKG